MPRVAGKNGTHTFSCVCLVVKKRPRKLRGRFYWLPELGSNQRPADYNACALDYLITLGMILLSNGVGPAQRVDLAAQCILEGY